MIVKNTWGSIVRYVKDKAPDWTFVDFEDHANIHELPEADCVGLSGLGFQADDGTDRIIFTIAVSTYNDKNLFRQRKLMDELYEEFRKTGKTITLYDADTLVELGSIVVNSNTVLAPMARAEKRAYQILSVEAQLALN
jgi:hypothetical protein